MTMPSGPTASRSAGRARPVPQPTSTTTPPGGRCASATAAAYAGRSSPNLVSQVAARVAKKARDSLRYQRSRGREPVGEMADHRPGRVVQVDDDVAAVVAVARSGRLVGGRGTQPDDHVPPPVGGCARQRGPSASATVSAALVGAPGVLVGEGVVVGQAGAPAAGGAQGVGETVGDQTGVRVATVDHDGRRHRREGVGQVVQDLCPPPGCSSVMSASRSPASSHQPWSIMQMRPGMASRRKMRADRAVPSSRGCDPLRIAGSVTAATEGGPARERTMVPHRPGRAHRPGGAGSDRLRRQRRHRQPATGCRQLGGHRQRHRVRGGVADRVVHHRSARTSRRPTPARR